MYKKVLLNNGIPLVLYSLDDVRSACMGIWVKTGSRYEDRTNNGISHFLEHMLFKGTEKRTAQAIAMESDNLGAELNAFTSTEITAYYIKSLDEHLPQALELLTDIFQNSTLPAEDIEKEKGVVAEEVKMVEDSPSDYIHDIFSRSVWGEGGLGLSVLGSIGLIDGFTRDNLDGYRKERYGAGNIVVACSGKFNEEALAGHLNDTVGSLGNASELPEMPVPRFNDAVNIVPKELSEAHICLGMKGIAATSDERFRMYLLNTIVGSGASSRLFQEIREKRGLVYSIYSYNSTFIDTGLWGIYAGTDRSNVKDVIDITVNEIRNISDSVRPDELTKAKNQLKGNLIFALESTNNRMTSIARQEINYGRYYTPEEIIKSVDSISLEDLKAFATGFITDSPFALTVYGPVDEGDARDFEKILK